MKKARETRKQIERDGPRIVQTHELWRVAGGDGQRIIPPGAITGLQW